MKKWLYPVSCLALIAMLSACGPNNAAGPNNTDGTNRLTRSYAGPHTQNTVYQGRTFSSPYQDGMIYGGGSVYNRGTPFNAGNGWMFNNPLDFNNTTTGYQGVGSFNRQLADRLAQVADNIPGVDGASCIVRGNDVVVGVNPRNGITDTRQRQAIENQVYQAVRSAAPNCNIRVTSDTNLLSRIRNMDQSLRMYNNGSAAGPDTVTGNLAQAGNDFADLLRDLGRTVTAPFR